MPYSEYKTILDTSGRELIKGRQKILDDAKSIAANIAKQRAKDAKERNKENKRIQDDFKKTLKTVTGDDLEDSQANVDALNADQGIKAGFYGTIKDAVTEENQALTALNNKYPNASDGEKQGWYDDANLRLNNLTELTSMIKLYKDKGDEAVEADESILDNFGMQSILTGINEGGDVKLIKTSSGYVIQSGEYTFTAAQLRDKLNNGGFNTSKELKRNPKDGDPGYGVYEFLKGNVAKKGAAESIEGFTGVDADGNITYDRSAIKSFMLGSGPRGEDLLPEFDDDNIAARYWATLFDLDGDDPYIDPDTGKGDEEKLNKLKSKVIDEYMKDYGFLAEEQTAAVEDELDDDVVDVNLADDDTDKNIGPNVIPTVEVETEEEITIDTPNVWEKYDFSKEDWESLGLDVQKRIIKHNPKGVKRTPIEWEKDDRTYKWDQDDIDAFWKWQDKHKTENKTLEDYFEEFPKKVKRK